MNIDEGARPLVPRGGPVFAPDFVSQLTRVSDFESEVFHAVESLKAELCSKLSSSSNEAEEDISVDDLRIMMDEDLVSEAMKVAFQEAEPDGNSADLLENLSISREEDIELNRLRNSEEMNCQILCETTAGPSSRDTINQEESNLKQTKRCSLKRKRKGQLKLKRKGNLKQMSKERGRITHGEHVEFEENALAKVEELAKLREKQKEDRASAQLHSLKDSCRGIKLAPLSSENIGSLKSLESLVNPDKMKASNAREHLCLQYPEVVLTIEVYDSKMSMKKIQEIVVLGQQFLTELKDSIYCSTNLIMHKTGQSDPSGYFLIEDLFCNDMRDPKAIDYSKPILDWLKNSKEDAAAKWNYIVSGKMKKHHKALVGDQSITNTPSFRAIEMEKMRFRDLKFRIGAGYLYCHQGDCKHLIMIRDMRLLHPEGMQNRAAFPLLTYQSKLRVRKCGACHVYKATKVCVDDKWAGENPAYFCDNCYYLLHYSEDGSLLYDQFSVYDYVQDL